MSVLSIPKPGGKSAPLPESLASEFNINCFECTRRGSRIRYTINYSTGSHLTGKAKGILWLLHSFTTEAIQWTEIPGSSPSRHRSLLNNYLWPMNWYSYQIYYTGMRRVTRHVCPGR